MIFRSVAVGSVGIFVPVYLYTLGYSLTEIMTVYGWFSTAIALCSYGTALLVARFGPKHVIMLSYVVQLLSSLLFLSQGQCQWPLFILGGVWGIAANLFFIPYHVDFSKIKHANHSGKEVGYMYIMQKVGLTVGPLLGGVVATLLGPSYVFLTACILLAVGALPLLKTAEPVQTRQRLDFSLSVRKIANDLKSSAALQTEDVLTKLLWPAYIGIFVLGKGVYAKLGVLASVSVALSITATYIFGKLADKRRGHQMIRTFVALNSIVHLLRPFVTTFTQTIGINIANDSVTVGYVLPYLKGMYAAADDLPGRRIVYIASLEMIGGISRALACWMLALVASVVSAHTTLTIGFVLAALASLLIASEKFKALNARTV